MKLLARGRSRIRSIPWLHRPGFEAKCLVLYLFATVLVMFVGFDNPLRLGFLRVRHTHAGSVILVIRLRNHFFFVVARIILGAGPISQARVLIPGLGAALPVGRKTLFDPLGLGYLLIGDTFAG